MNTQNDNGKDATVLENTVIDGGDMTEAEAKIVAEGLDDPDAKLENTDDENGTSEAERIAAETATAEAAEAQRLADEAAANADTQRQTEEQQAQERREADALAQQNALKAPVKPEPPMDFDDARKKLNEQFNDGALDSTEYADKRDEITLAQNEYKADLRDYERDQRDFASRVEDAKAKVQDAWNAAAYQWEQKNKHFVENPLRVDVMARSIQKVATDAKAAGEFLTHEQLLEKAGQVAMDYCGYTPPVADAKDGKQEVHDALKNRVPDKTGRTLGDVPNAGTPMSKGNESFQSLDNLGIVDLEEAVQHMTADQTEKYLRDSPGANSTSRSKED